jgi:hypothetical protein
MAQTFTSQRSTAPLLKMGGVHVLRSTNQTLVDSTDTTIEFDQVMYDDAGFWTALAPGNLVIPPGFSGRYTLSAWVNFAANASGNRHLSININGSNAVSQRSAAFATNSGGLTVSATLELTAGDVIQFHAFQLSGGSLDLQASTGGGIHASIQRVGVAAGTSPTGVITQSALTCSDNVLLGRLGLGASGTIVEYPMITGTFSPLFSFATPGDLSVSYSSQNGRYARVGPLVTVNVELVFTPTHTTASGAARISGLPFATHPSSRNTYAPLMVFTNFSWGTSCTMAMAQLGANGDTLNMWGEGPSVLSSQWGTAQFPTGQQRNIQFSTTYWAA